MITTINVDAARKAIETKYTRTVNNVVPVSWSFTTQAGLNALMTKATEVFVGQLSVVPNDSDATNTISFSLLDFSTAVIVASTKVNINVNVTQPLFNFNSYNLAEFSDMTIAYTGGALCYFYAQGWKFTFS